MKKPVLLFAALVASLVVVGLLWRLLQAPERGAHTASAQSPAETEQASAPAALAAATPPAAEESATPAVPAPAEAERNDRTASAAGGRTLRGEVGLPPGAPADDTLRVLALAENLAPRQV